MRRATLVALAVVVAVIAGAAWLAGRAGSGAPGGDADRRGDPGSATTPGDPDGDLPDDLPDDHVMADAGHGATADDDEPAAVTWFRQLTTLPFDDVAGLVERGVGSDLPAHRQRAAREVATRFVVADLSGEGREAFPEWWGTGRATAAPSLACCTGVEVLAAGAASYPAEEPLVLALVVWSATAVDGVSQLGPWEASFVFLHPTADAGYTPVDPSTVTSWQAP